MASMEVPVTGHLTGTGVQELRSLRGWQRSSDTGGTGQTTEGVFWFNTTVSSQRFKYYADGAVKNVPRLDLNETLTSQWTSSVATGTAPFSIASTTKVSNLNVDLLDGYDTATAATASTVAVRESDGRLKCADPTDATDCVNLRFLRAELRNADDKGSVRVSTVASLPSYTFSANVLTASANSAFPAQDGVTLVLNDLIAVMYEGGAGNQYYLGTAHALNGIYKLTQVGDASNPWKLTRADNFNITSEVTAGAFFFVSEGTNQSNSKWALITDDPIYLRTDAPAGLSAVTASGGTLTASTTYYYRVTMVDASGGEAATSLEVSATTDVTNKTINITWTTYTEASSYRIYRSTTSGSYGATSLVGTATTGTFSDNGVSLTTGTPPTASTLQFAKIGSNAFYSAGNGIDISGTVISVKIEGSTTYVANRILFNGSTSTIDSDANLTWDGSKLNVANSTSGGTVNLVGRSSDDAAAINFRVTADTSTYAYIAPDTNEFRLYHIDGFMSFYPGGAERWRITSAGILQSNGAQTIQSSSGILTVTGTGGLTLSTAANTNILLSPNGTGNVGINTSSPSYKLSVLSGSGGVPQLHLADITTDASEKVSTVIMSHYTNAEEAVAILNTVSRSATTSLEIGGNRSSLNTVTEIAFYTAANNTTVTGTQRMSISSSGVVSIANLTQKSVLFAGASGAVSQDNANFQYDSANVTFAIGGSAAADIGATFRRSGAVVTSQGAAIANNLCTSSTASIIKYALNVQSTGVWNGAGATNYGIYIEAISGGTTNWALYNNTAANVYLGTGNVGIGTTSPGTALDVTGVIRGSSDIYAGSGGVFTVATNGDAKFYGRGTGSAILGNTTNGAYLTVINGGNVGIATSSPSYILSLGGNSSRTIGMERHTTADTAGNSLTIQAGSATSGATNKNGGNAIIKPGVSTGTGTAVTELYYTPAGASGTLDNTPVVGLTVTAAGYANAANGFQVGAAAASGVILRGDGTKFIASTATFPNTTTRGAVLIASAANVWAALAVGSAGKILRSDGTDLVYSTATFPDTAAQYDLIYASATNTWSNLAKVNSSVLTTNSSGQPTWMSYGTPVGSSDLNAHPVAIKWFNVGDGASTTITLTHSFGTRDVVVQLYENTATDNYKTAPLVAITRPTTNTVVLEFITAPASNDFRAAVIVGMT